MTWESLRETPPWEWPEDMGARILDALGNPRVEETDRRIAAELAGDLGVIDDTIARVLLSIAQDAEESLELRTNAAISLGPVLEYADTESFEDPDAVPITQDAFERVQDTLRRLYHDGGAPPELRRHVLESAVRSPLDWHAGAVHAAYLSDDPEWKLSAVFCMCFVSGFVEQILESLESDDEQVHYHAVCAAGAWQIGAAWTHVRGLFDADEIDKDLLLAAIDAAASIRPAEAQPLLEELCESDDEEVAETAHEALLMATACLESELDED